MRTRKWFLAGLVVLLVIPVFTAATASADTATQFIQVGVWEPGLLTIEVDQHTDLGASIPGNSVGNQFGIGVLNTSSPAAGWEILVTGTDLTDGWVMCDEWGENCWFESDPDFTATIPKSNVHITGGGLAWWSETSPVSGYDGYLSDTPLQLMTGTEMAWGGMFFDYPFPWMDVMIPVDAATTNYIAELTYTIQAWTPAP